MASHCSILPDGGGGSLDRGIYNDIDDRDGIDADLAVNHDDYFVLSDPHLNQCNNHHSFLGDWLQRFRGASKRHLQ